MPETVTEKLPGKWWGMLVVATVAAIPFSSALIQIELSHKRALGLTLYDPLVWLSAFLLFVHWLRTKTLLSNLKELIYDCWPSFLFFAVSLISILSVNFSVSQSKTLFLKSAIQLFEYCVLGVCVFYFALKDSYWREKVIGAFAACTVFALLSIAYDVVHQNKLLSSHFIGGILGERNTYGMFAVFALPILWTCAFELGAYRKAVFFFSGISLAFALFLCTSGGMVLGSMIAVTIAASAYGKRRLLLLPIIFALLAMVDPRKPLDKLIDSVQVYVLHKDPVTREQSRMHTMRYYRWSANLEMIRKNPRLGVGLGQYQKHVNNYYGGISLPEGRTDQPDLYDVKANEPLSFGWFFLTATETGLLGAGALLFLLCSMLRSAVIAAGKGAKISWGIIGVCAGVAIAGWFASPMVRGCGGALAFIMALTWSMQPRPAVKREPYNEQSNP